MSLVDADESTPRCAVGCTKDRAGCEGLREYRTTTPYSGALNFRPRPCSLTTRHVLSIRPAPVGELGFCLVQQSSQESQDHQESRRNKNESSSSLPATLLIQPA